MTYSYKNIHPLKVLVFRLFRKFLHSRPVMSLLGISSKFAPSSFGGWMEITHHSLELPGLPDSFHGLRLVQISDLHVGTWIDQPLLAEAIQVVNAQQPDLVVITGDFVTYDPPRYAPVLHAELSRLHAPCGVVAVLGNHDHWSDPKAVRSILQGIGIAVLANDVLPLERGGDTLYLCGLDSASAQADDFPALLARLPQGAPAILLAHEPDVADQAASYGRFMLQLSGHSHGGQIQLPIIGAPVVPYLGKKYMSGRYQINGMVHYTNRGLGTAELHLRFNCPPEITVFELRSAKNGNH